MTYQRNETPEALMAPLTLDTGADLGAQVEEPAPRAAIGGWQPIETAPRDKTRRLYLARFDSEGQLQELDFDGVWEYWEESWELSHINGWCWMSAKGIEEPTHWAYQDASIPAAGQSSAKQAEPLMWISKRGMAAIRAGASPTVHAKKGGKYDIGLCVARG